MVAMAILGEKTEGVPGVENKESTTTPTATTTTTTATTNTPYNSGSNDKEASFGIPLAQRQPSALSAASSKHSAVAGIGASDVRGGDWSGNGDENDVPADGKYTHRHGHELPFSKARSIALVATVTGAAFLNVSCLKHGSIYQLRMHVSYSLRPKHALHVKTPTITKTLTLTLTPNCRHYAFKALSLSFPALDMTYLSPKVVSNGSSHRTH